MMDEVFEVIADAFRGTDGIIGDGADVEVIFLIINCAVTSRGHRPADRRSFQTVHLLHAEHELLVCHGDLQVLLIKSDLEQDEGDGDQ